MFILSGFIISDPDCINVFQTSHSISRNSTSSVLSLRTIEKTTKFGKKAGHPAFFHSSDELIFTSVPFLLEISPLCPAFFDTMSMYNTFLLRPAMFHEIQRCVPLLSWLRLVCMVSMYSKCHPNCSIVPE